MVYRLGVIGGGNMGGAVVRGAIAQFVLPANQIIVAEIDAARRDELASLGCNVTADAAAVPAQCEQIMLATKPQTFATVAAEIQPNITTSLVVISIMGGWRSERIRQTLGGQVRVVRAMPNLACQIGKGATAISVGEGARPGDEVLAMQLFNSLGHAVVLDESLLDAVTAASASGLAYVFLLAESMQQAAEQMGIPHAAARKLMTQTIVGAGSLLDQRHDRTATQWRQAVTSPGGTTAAALEVMFEKELPEIVIEALLAARDRGIELGQGRDQ